MKKIVMIAGLLALALTVRAYAADVVAPTQKIALPGVNGNFDHMALDAKGQRLFLAATGNNTLEVIDLAQGKPIRSVAGFKKPHGVIFLPETNKVYVSNGDGGEVYVVDATALTIGAKIKFSNDADFMVYSPSDKRIYVAHEEGLGIIDTAKDTAIGSIKLESTPESFQISPEGTKIFVNLPKSSEMGVIDRVGGKISTKWKLENAGGNTPMALSPEGYILIGCRKPAKFVVLDINTGEEVASAEADGGGDDLFYDVKKDKVYMSCGDGFIDVFTRDGDGVKKIAAIPTRKGAKTSLYVPESGKCFVAAPKSDAAPAELWVYDFSK